MYYVNSINRYVTHMTLTTNCITIGTYTISNAKQKSGCIGYLRNGAIMYEIEFTHDALRDLRNFKKFEQNIIFEAIQTQLVYEPLIETRNRFRREPPDIAAWELRIGVFRVFYNVEQSIQVVCIVRVGEKPNNTVLFRG